MPKEKSTKQNQLDPKEWVRRVEECITIDRSYPVAYPRVNERCIMHILEQYAACKNETKRK